MASPDNCVLGLNGHIISEGNSLTTELPTTDLKSPEQPNPCQRELSIEIPAAVVAAETESVVQRYQKLARVPGFRKGKVPASIVRQQIGRASCRKKV